MKLRNALVLLAFLVVGTVLLALTTYQTVIPIAAWVAPIFLLRFTRKAGSHWIALPAILVAATVAHALAIRDPFLGERAVWMIALMFGIPMGLAYFADRLIGKPLVNDPIARSLILPAGLVIAEVVNAAFNPFGSFTSQAYSQFGEIPLLQMIAVSGTYGITFLIGWFAGVVNGIWESDTKEAARRATVPFAVVVVALLVAGGARLYLVPPPEATVRVAAIPADQRLFAEATSGINFVTIAQQENERAAARAKFTSNLEELFRRSEAAARSGAKVIAWSEGAGIFLEEDQGPILDRASAFTKNSNVYLLISSTIVLKTERFPWVLNRAMMFDPTGTMTWEYDKSYPVPGVESALFVRGERHMPLAETPYGRIAAAISFDGDFASFMRQAGKQKADILLIPANDHLALRKTHPQMHIFRAIENGFSVVRPTGNGTSIVADPLGRVLASTDSTVTPSAIMLADVPTKRVFSLYPIVGDTFALVMVLMWIGLIAHALNKSRLVLSHVTEPQSV